MPWLDRTYKLLFFATPATGSSAVIQALRRAGTGENYPAHNIERGGKLLVRHKHGTARQLERAGLVDDAMREYVWAAGVRNPFQFYVAKFLRVTTDRQANVENKTSFLYRLPPIMRKRRIRALRAAASMTFRQYLDRWLDRQACPFAPMVTYYEPCDIVLRQELLASDFERLRREVGLPDSIKLAALNVTGAMPDGRTYRDYYQPDMVQRVYDKNEPFFKRFPEYSFEGCKG